MPILESSRLSEPARGAILLLGAMLGSIVLTRSWVLFTWPFWLDEVATVLVVGQPGIWHSLQSIAHGADNNPPLLHFTLRLVGWLFGGLSPVVVRVFSFACVWGALSVVYALLRPRASRTAAFAGAFALWTSYIVVRQAFDGRFYGPWLLLSALYVLAVTGRPERPVSTRRVVGIGIAAIGLCTIHYFGILTWLLVMAATFRTWSTRDQRRRLWAALAGPLALLACLPIYLGQRKAMGHATWIEPVSVAQLQHVLEAFLGWPSFLAVLLLWALSQGFRSRRADPARPWSTPELGLLGLAGLLPLLVGVSILVQPVLGAHRYAIPALLAWSPLVCFGVEALERRLRALVVIGLFGFSLLIVKLQAKEFAGFERAIVDNASTLAPFARTGRMIIAKDLHALYPLAQRAPLTDSTIRFLAPSDEEFRSAYSGSDSTLPEARAFGAERAFAPVHHAFYGFPALITPAALRQYDSFILVGFSEVEEFGQRWFPGYSRQHVAHGVYELRRANPR